MKNRRRKIQKKKIARDFTLPMNSDLASIREGVVIRLEKNEHTRRRFQCRFVFFSFEQ